MSRTLQLGVVEVDEARLVELCRRYQVRELSLFGSAARGEMRPDSDIDSKNGLKPLIRPSVLEEARLVYAA